MPKLNIFMVVPGMPFDGNTLKERSLGGSETAGLCMARELAKRGHNVTMMCNIPKHEGEFDGVTYMNLVRAEEIIQKAPHDILIVQRNPQFFGLNTASKINVLWNHDLATKSMLPVHQAAAWNIDWVFLLSMFHVKQFKEIYSFWDAAHIRLTRNGIDLEDFPKVQNKIPKKIMYTARPERGLYTLLKPGGIMEMLYQADPNIHLYVAGYDNTTQHMATFYQYLWGRCQELPNVTNLGHLTKQQLYQHYAETELYLYPTLFEEISCITAMECMACGVPMITSSIAALPETLSEKTAIFLPAESNFELYGTPGQDYMEQFTGHVLALLQDTDRRRKMSFQCRERAKQFSWAGVAEQWEGMFIERFQEATKDKDKLIQHFLYHDDVMAACHVGEVKNIEKISWAFDEKAHEDHYNKFAEKEFEKRNANHVAWHFDNVFPREQRWATLKEWFRIHGIKPETKVLDVGCGPGYFSVAMANEFGVDVTGIDISGRYLKEAWNLKEQRLKNGKAQFQKEPEGLYDVVIISEIIEHLGYIEPQDFVKEFEPYLTNDGHFLVTTPFGPLKRAAPKRSNRHHDLHLRHLECMDIHELFGKKQDFEDEILYWQHTPSTNELLGWYMYSFKKGGEYGQIDMDRKCLVQIPRDTLSVCMIAKNEQTIIGRCLDSIHEIADEIILIDTGSKDATPKIGELYGAKVFNGSDPFLLRQGFETPRNESIAKATGDWILWIDADEELQGFNNLRKYLRNSIYDGFRIRQHHFSCQPVGATVIDRPIRLFRRKDNVRFYGLIHEHPGIDENAGVGEVVELSDADIAHNGYYTEPERRKKFWRNLPMMLADIEKYPNRVLGKWLYMRDLSHLINWQLQQTGALTEDSRLKAHEIIQIYRNNFLSAGGHLMVDGLGYYSMACARLGVGIDYAWSISMHNGKNPPGIRIARFADRSDFNVFVTKLIEEQSWITEGRYR